MDKLANRSWQRTALVGARFSLMSVALFMAGQVPSYAQFAGNKADSSQSSLLLYQQVSTLQQQVRELRGETQVLSHEIDLLKQRQKQLYTNLDNRISNLESSSQSGGAIPKTPLAVSTSSVPAASSTIITPSTTVSSGGGGVQPTPNNHVSNKKHPATPVQSLGGKKTSGASPGSSAHSAEASEAQLKAYQKAFNYLLNSHYQKAIQGFKKFITQYPRSPFIPNAQYWIGEAYYVQQDYTKAIKHLKIIINQYGQSSKVSDAMLKIGYCQYALKQWAQSKNTLQDVVNQFPGTTEAMLAMDRLKLIKTQGH